MDWYRVKQTLNQDRQGLGSAQTLAAVWMNRLRPVLRGAGLATLLSTLVAAAPWTPVVQAPAPEPPGIPAVDVEVTGQVLYGSANGAQTAAVVDILDVYNNNPAYMRLKEFGLSETQGRGKQLFEEARASTNKALAAVARRHGIDVITVPDGVTSDEGVSDLTSEVMDQLPTYCIEGNLLHGSNPRLMQSVGELDSQMVLEAIPAYIEWTGLDENDAQFHLLQKSYLDKFSKAVKKVARDQGLDGLAEQGDVTSRHGSVPDVTRAVIEALAG